MMISRLGRAWRGVARGRFTKLSIEYKGETLCLGNGVGVIVRAIWYYQL